jgi:hypothetical protein
VRVSGETVVETLLIETGPDAALGRLELATADGLLTLHPVAGTLHGNVVRPTGIEHVTLPWGDGHVLHVSGAPTSAGAAARLLRERLGVGEGRSIPGVLVHADLSIRPVTFRVARIGPRGWRFITADTGAETAITVDLDGIPTLEAAMSWPLEHAAER